jgi:hypothetical protein
MKSIDDALELLGHLEAAALAHRTLRDEFPLTEQQIFARQALEQLGGDFAPTLSPRPGPGQQPEPERRAGQEPSD